MSADRFNLSPVDCLPIDLPAGRLLLEQFIPSVVTEAGDRAFGTLAFTPQGEVWRDHDGRSWLYTSTRNERGRWISQARWFSCATLEAGPPQTVLEVHAPDLWAVVHLVIRLCDERWLAFYSAGRGIRAAIAESANGPLRRLDNFSLAPEQDWEWHGGDRDIASCEANGCFVPISFGNGHYNFWLGYDSYHADQGSGRLGWARVCWDTRAETLSLKERHVDNPLPLGARHWHAARCGGNLASDVTLSGYRPFFFYSRPTRSVCLLSLSLARADDPLHLNPVWQGPIDKPLGDELLVEKFETWQEAERLHMLYESRHRDGTWNTGYRRYVWLPPDDADTAKRIERAGATTLTREWAKSHDS